MHILHTVLYTFPKLLTRRICWTIKSFFRPRDTITDHRRWRDDKFFDKVCQRKHFPSSLKLSFTKIGPLAKDKCVLLTKWDARTVSHGPSFLPLGIMPQARYIISQVINLRSKPSSRLFFHCCFESSHLRQFPAKLVPRLHNLFGLKYHWKKQFNFDMLPLSRWETNNPAKLADLVRKT